MNQPASLAQALYVVHQLESAAKAFQAAPTLEKKKSVNVVSTTAVDEKISAKICELKA